MSRAVPRFFEHLTVRLGTCQDDCRTSVPSLPVSSRSFSVSLPVTSGRRPIASSCPPPLSYHLSPASFLLLARSQLPSQSSVLHSSLAPSGPVFHLYLWRAPRDLPSRVLDPYQASSSNFSLSTYWLLSFVSDSVYLAAFLGESSLLPQGLCLFHAKGPLAQ